MGQQYVQSNLTGGELAPTLHARVDIEKYNTSLADAENVVIVPQGGMRRRPGLSKIQGTPEGEVVETSLVVGGDGKLTEDGRLESFVFNKTQQYLLVFTPGYINVLRDGVLVAGDIATPYSTLDIVNDLDVIQSADTVIITHGDYPPAKLVRGATDADWTLSDLELTIPLFNFTSYQYLYENSGSAYTVSTRVGDIIWNYDDNDVKGLNNRFYQCVVGRNDIDLSVVDFTGTDWTDLGVGKEEVWSAEYGYPISCAFHQNRLWFGGSPSKPTSVWGSKTNSPFDFSAQEVSGAIPDDHAIFDTIESDQYNRITNIFAGRQLQVFTTGSEYVNTVDVITPSNSAWASQTGYGSKGIRPVFIDGATLFVDSSNRTIREFVFSFDEDANVSNSITLLASHLLTDIHSLDTIKGTNIDVSDFVYAVNVDGTLAVMNTLRNEGILGWTHWTTQGQFKDVCVVDKTTYFIVLRNGNYFIEVINEDTYTDHNVVETGTYPEIYNMTFTGDNLVFGGDNLIFTDPSTGVAKDHIVTNFDGSFVNTDFKVIADYSIMPDATYEGTSGDNQFTLSRDAYRVEVGLGYNTRILTLPFNTQLQTGATLHRRKRIVKADINVYESLGIYAKNIHAGDRMFTVVLDRAPEPFTGFKEMYLLGYGRLVQLEVTQENPLPMLVRAIGYEIAY